VLAPSNATCARRAVDSTGLVEYEIDILRPLAVAPSLERIQDLLNPRGKRCRGTRRCRFQIENSAIVAHPSSVSGAVQTTVRTDRYSAVRISPVRSAGKVVKRSEDPTAVLVRELVNRTVPVTAVAGRAIEISGFV